jgi:hypothetical protein
MGTAVKTVAAAAAAGALIASLGLAACATQTGQQAPATVIAPAAAESDALPAGTDPAPFGQRRSVAGGLVVEVSGPKTITPSDTAYPKSKRAVAFEITIDNEGTDVFHTDDLLVTATANGHTAAQVADSTQGYTGTSDIPAQLAPGKSAHVTIAFAAPTESAAVELRVQAEDEAGGTADFAGQA